ncbi:PaREP1 domain containing protein [Vulcanisaeta moutnovskia 768-28]|uniref:PaREP1 domain containing protein n=1 Tax=Vulcanisaeta moutnovskia (strain 768-28) TaxID=985053 RepID=F0QV49_VULM7|nr:PaREP1 family protein [Vulcanisaeta moutnovskia]ADY00781.1 PaREP1 domain containing protein [Vulcanisaeta moutnovskia 768-28]
MSIPQSLIDVLRRRGLDVDYIIDILTTKLELDPSDAARAHAELALTAFNEGLSFVDKGDVMQASEKLYKAVEECIKALAIVRGLDEAKEALSKGRWTVSLLDNAASKLGEIVERAWDAAYFLHINGFHEVRIGIDEVRRRVKYITPLIEELRREVKI